MTGFLRAHDLRNVGDLLIGTFHVGIDKAPGYDFVSYQR